ncbi:MAG: SDR family oxidoreductase [Streptomyces sp.]|nr:SDR family oxidoreductase [Streptomyces sp.]
MDIFGALHLAVNNAWHRRPEAPTAEFDLDAFSRVIRTNLDGVLYSRRNELPAPSRRTARAAPSSTPPPPPGLVGLVGFVAYVAAKHDVVGMAKTAAAEYAVRNIRTNAVGPGSVETPLLKGLDQEVYDGLVGLHPSLVLASPRRSRNRSSSRAPSAPRSSPAATTWSTAPAPPSEPQPSRRSDSRP